jgi:hypothetical protein
MRKTLTLLTLAPAPLFFVGLLYSVWNNIITPHTAAFSLQLCSTVSLGYSPSHHWEMPAMWAVMFLAHLAPWIVWHNQNQRRVS